MPPKRREDTVAFFHSDVDERVLRDESAGEEDPQRACMIVCKSWWVPIWDNISNVCGYLNSYGKKWIVVEGCGTKPRTNLYFLLNIPDNKATRTRGQKLHCKSKSKFSRVCSIKNELVEQQFKKEIVEENE